METQNITEVLEIATTSKINTDNLVIHNEDVIPIIDISGKTIYSSYILNKATINISKFSKGVYTIKVYLDKNIDIKKFVKE